MRGSDGFLAQQWNAVASVYAAGAQIKAPDTSLCNILKRCGRKKKEELFLKEKQGCGCGAGVVPAAREEEDAVIGEEEIVDADVVLGMVAE